MTSCDAMAVQNQQPQVDAVDSEGTPVPTPTPDPSGYQAILQPEACLAADWTTLQSSEAQGDLIAWQPHQDGAAEGVSNLAYLDPTQKSAWYTGELKLAIGPKYEQRISLGSTVLATGDLTWSPSGRRLAFLAYRPNEGLYTAMVVGADGSGLTDLFPADLARTDNRSSRKAIIGWKDEQTLEVISSCGEECRQAFSFEIGAAASPALTPTEVADYHELSDNLTITRHELEFKAENFPKYMSSPNWSPDEQSIIYLDKRGLLWLLSTERKITYMLDIGLRDVYETQWASTSDSVAIRAEDRIFVFEVPCRP